MAERVSIYKSTLQDIADAIKAKNSSSVTYKPSEMPDAISALSNAAEIELSALSVSPTGQEFTKTAEDGTGYSSVTVAGDDNLIPKNVAKDVTIYGVTGIYEGNVGTEYPMLGMTDEQLSYYNYARTNLYTGDYEHLVVWDSDEWIAVSFLMSGFTINSYDLYTTELTATGWVTCGYTKSTGEWTTHDYRTEESPGGNYARYIVFASCRVKYGNQILFPVGVTDTVKINSISYNDDAGTVTLVYATGQTEVLTWVKDDSGNITGVTDSQGHTTSLWEVST